MAKKVYGLRMEYSDSTLSEAYWTTSNKAEALKLAKRHARNQEEPTVARFWVDELTTERGIGSFEAHWQTRLTR